MVRKTAWGEAESRTSWFRQSAVVLLTVLVTTGCGNDKAPKEAASAASPRETADDETAAEQKASDEHPPLQFDFTELSADVADRGFDAVLADLEAAHPTDRRLVAALDQIRPVVEDDPQQLWFQLQSHTRLKNWDDIQEQLLAAAPKETLIARTSELAAIMPSAIHSWQLSDLPITYLALSSDSRRLYCGTGGDFVIFDMKSRKIARRLSETGSALTTGLGSAGKDLLVTLRFERASEKQSPPGTKYIIVDDVESGREIARLRDGYRSVTGFFGNVPLAAGVILSPDGERILVQYDDITFVDRKLDDLRNAERFRSRTNNRGCHTCFLAFVDKGAQLIVGDDLGFIRQFRYPERRESYLPKKLLPKAGAYAMSPDGSRIVACCAYGRRPDWKGQLAVWDVAERRILSEMQANVGTLSATFLSDTDTIAAGTVKGRVITWRVGEDKASSSVPAHETAIARIVAAPDGETVFTGDVSGIVREVDLNARDAEVEPEAADIAWFRRFVSPDGRWSAGLSRDALYVWDTETDKQLYVIESGDELRVGQSFVQSVGLDPDAKTVHFSAGAKIIHWNATNQQATTVDVEFGADDMQAPQRGRQKPPSLFVSPTGKHAVASVEKRLLVFDGETGLRRLVIAPGEACYFGKTHFFPSADQIAVTYRDIDANGQRVNGVRIFDLNTGEEIRNMPHGGQLSGTVFARKAGMFLTTGQHKHGNRGIVLKIWESNGAEPHVIELGEDNARVVGISDDGARALTVTPKTGTVALWDVPARKIIRRFDLGIQVESDDFDGRTLLITELYTKTRHAFEYVREPSTKK